MIEILSKKRLPRETLRRRQQEIERCLTACGVLRDVDRRRRRQRVAEHELAQMQRLRQALVQLGPVFSAFGLYLASRLDLLPVHDCLELATIADCGEVTPMATVQELLTQELDCPLETVFSVFEDEPFASRLFIQSHYARLNDGKAVTVTVVHPELQEYLTCDMELLSVLKPMLAGTAGHDVVFADAVADFRRMVEWQNDLLSKVKTFEALRRDTQEFAILKIPQVYNDLSSARVLTLARISGTTLGELIAAVEATQGGDTQRAQALNAYPEVELHTLAHRLCLVWLRQALLGGQFPVEWHPEDIVVLPHTQIVFTGGVFASLPTDAKKHLWHYVIATATDAPDTACSYLWRELVQPGRPGNAHELYYRFREVVPFRDGGWSGNGVGSSLSEHLFVHWKLVSEYGLRPQPHLLCFYRGLFHMLRLARRLVPESDTLPEVLQDVRTIAMLGQFQEMMQLSTLSDTLDRYTAMLMEFPRKFDDALTLTAERSAHLPPQGRQNTRPIKHHGTTVVVALLLVLASVVLLSHHLAASGMAGVWIDRSSAIAFVILGALLLRIASRT